VIGVTEDKSYHWRPGDSGLIPVGYKKRYLQQEKDIIYKESGGIYLINTENIIKGSLLGESVGHIDLSHEESLKIRTKNDYLMATKVIVSH
jgi:CMP-N-acetylneuraminic acid synthetase